MINYYHKIILFLYSWKLNVPNKDWSPINYVIYHGLVMGLK